MMLIGGDPQCYPSYRDIAASGRKADIDGTGTLSGRNTATVVATSAEDGNHPIYRSWVPNPHWGKHNGASDAVAARLSEPQALT